MTSTGILFILTGLFIAINAKNLVGVINGTMTFNQTVTTPKS